MPDTVVVGSPEHRAQRKAKLHARFDQALEEVSDEGVFSPDQITKLRNAIIIMRWGVEEAL